MSRPWMPLYVADYKADTAHLSTVEHGAYLLLIMHYWATGGIPNENKRLAAIAGLLLDDWCSIRSAVLEFFDEVDGKLQHGRIDAEIAITEEKREKRSIAGQKGGLASAKVKQTSSNATPLLNQSQPPLQSHKKERTASQAVASATRLKADEVFEEFWKSYPKRDGANPKAPARKAFFAFVKSGTDPGEIVGGAKRCAVADAAKIGTSYIPQAIKWLRDRRWEDYTEAISDEKKHIGWRPGLPTPEEMQRKYAGTANGSAASSVQHEGSSVPEGSGEDGEPVPSH